MNYFSITPRERIASGYLKWDENFDIRWGKWWLHLIGIFRCVTGITYEPERKELEAHIRNFSQRDIDKYSRMKDRWFAAYELKPKLKNE